MVPAARQSRSYRSSDIVNWVDYNEFLGAAMSETQTFIDSARARWSKIDFLPGVELLPLAEPVPHGSVHLARLSAGTIIPPHTHSGDEFVYVLSGTIETGSTRCPAGTFWRTPAGTRQGPHVASENQPNASGHRFSSNSSPASEMKSSLPSV
jgi:hypothetical protein